jgi:hypothetical protein
MTDLASLYALASLEARLDHYLQTGVYVPAPANPYLTPKE